MGVDPWGQRFDDRMPIGDVRDRAAEIKYRTESGDEVDLPNLLSQRLLALAVERVEAGEQLLLAMRFEQGKEFIYHASSVVHLFL